MILKYKYKIYINIKFYIESFVGDDAAAGTRVTKSQATLTRVDT